MSNGLIELVEHLPRSRVLLVGDLMLDRYIFGNADRLSPEAPVPVLHYQKEEYRLGGAGSVAADLAALGAHVMVVGVLGQDEASKHVRRLLKEWNIDGSGIVEVANRPTVTKLRLVGSAQHRNPQQLIRLDTESSSPLTQEVIDQIVHCIDSRLADADIVCIEDYNKGTVIDVARQAIQMARARGLCVIVDPANGVDYRKYFQATALKLNRTEAERAAAVAALDENGTSPAAEKLLKEHQLEAVIVTLDKHGAYLATASGERRHLKTRERQVFDVTGAGDMVLAMITVARAAGASWTDAVALGNIAGGLEVEKFGCVPITPQEIIHDLLSESRESLGKQRALEQLLPEVNRHRALGRKIVFTNGVFDIVHLGHIEYFQFAKRQGDILVVAVNTDASVRRLKGPKRPIIPEKDRLKLLEELQSIDYVLTFEQDTPIKLIEQIKPDVLVKGADYSKEKVVGWDIVEACGGRVELAPLVDGRSTSSVIQKILEAYK